MTKKAYPLICSNPDCGRTFFDHRRKLKYCSPKCSKARNGLRSFARVTLPNSRHRRANRVRDAFGCHSKREWLDKLRASGFLCFYCGKELVGRNATRDHFIPLSKGGSDSISNIVPACRRCNCKKGTLTGQEFLAQILQREQGFSPDHMPAEFLSVYDPHATTTSKCNFKITKTRSSNRGVENVDNFYRRAPSHSKVTSTPEGNLLNPYIAQLDEKPEFPENPEKSATSTSFKQVTS
jgi:5-methylcytosine-specific restriction endonuclease McrA